MPKVCFKCHKRKDLRLFYQHPRMGDGHLNKCISCAKKDVNNRYSEPEARKRIGKYEQARFRTPERKRKVKIYADKRKATHPGKVMANRKLSYAVKSGQIKRLPCEICGDKKSQGHHPDYRQPLNVKWLCFIHHRQEHGQLKNQIKTI